ncbi:MAG: hypothetical protein IPH28_16925 [Cytophagaceae bacterium]|nr:hypothetical protein [Cytophagaceae bacterium]
MDIAFYLTDANGPRLQGSPGFMKAANYAKNKLTEFGLNDSRLEAWGDFGKGWELQKSYIAMTAPYYRPLIALPKVWTGGTKGLVQAEVLLVDETDTTALEQYKGKMKNKVILLYKNDKIKLSFGPDAKDLPKKSWKKWLMPNPKLLTREILLSET